jgi:hypothetical protein
MKKIEYTKPAVRVKIVMAEAALCEPSLPKDPNDEVDPEEGGAWSKDGDLEYFNYSTSRNVWDD